MKVRGRTTIPLDPTWTSQHSCACKLRQACSSHEHAWCRTHVQAMEDAPLGAALLLLPVQPNGV